MDFKKYVKELGFHVDGSKDFKLELKVPNNIEWNNKPLQRIDVDILYKRKYREHEPIGVYVASLSGIYDIKENNDSYYTFTYEPLKNVVFIAHECKRASHNALCYAVAITEHFLNESIIKVIKENGGNIDNNFKVDYKNLM